jgi:hypothetical protein
MVVQSCRDSPHNLKSNAVNDTEYYWFVEILANNSVKSKLFAIGIISKD